MQTTAKVQNFLSVFEIPDFIKPWIDRFFEDIEIELAEHRNAQQLWPLSRYVARYLKDRCIACGRCIKRCPFQAFAFAEKNQPAKPKSRTIHFNQNLCRGCGVCSTGCPEEAIEMTGIECKQSLINKILIG